MICIAVVSMKVTPCLLGVDGILIMVLSLVFDVWKLLLCNLYLDELNIVTLFSSFPCWLTRLLNYLCIISILFRILFLDWCVNLAWFTCRSYLCLVYERFSRNILPWWCCRPLCKITDRSNCQSIVSWTRKCSFLEIDFIYARFWNVASVYMFEIHQNSLFSGMISCIHLTGSDWCFGFIHIQYIENGPM